MEEDSVVKHFRSFLMFPFTYVWGLGSTHRDHLVFRSFSFRSIYSDEFCDFAGVGFRFSFLQT